MGIGHWDGPVSVYVCLRLRWQPPIGPVIDVPQTVLAFRFSSQRIWLCRLDAFSLVSVSLALSQSSHCQTTRVTYVAAVLKEGTGKVRTPQL